MNFIFAWILCSACFIFGFIVCAVVSQGERDE
jgi:hypothetical protein